MQQLLLARDGTIPVTGSHCVVVQLLQTGSTCTGKAGCHVSDWHSCYPLLRGLGVTQVTWSAAATQLHHAA